MTDQAGPKWRYIRSAELADHADVVAILRARTRWLADRGSDQWSTRQEVLDERMADRIRRGETWVVTEQDRQVIATISVTQRADPDFWTEDERAVPALYLSRMATDPTQAGQGLGRLMLAWAVREAARQGLIEARLDAWRTATGLHDYYRAQGWTHVRTVDVPGRYSGALFSRLAALVDVPGLVQLPRVSSPDAAYHGAHGVAGFIGQDAGYDVV